MIVTVKDILHHATIRDLQVLAGEHGLYRVVSLISLFDSPDFYEYLQGGEFLLTTAYIFRDKPEELYEVVKHIHKAGAAALGIKVGRHIQSVPENVIQLANELNFPIILIPVDQRFVDMNQVLTNIVKEQARIISVGEQLHRHFTHLVEKGGGVQDCLNYLMEYLGSGVGYCDMYFNTVYSKGCSENFASDLHTLSIEELQTKYNTYPISLDKKVYGYIILNDPTVHLNQLMAAGIQYASILLNLMMQKEIARIQVESKYRDEFIHDLLFNNLHSMEEIHSRARLYGWDFSKDMVALVIELDEFEQGDLYMMEEMRRKVLKRALEVFRQYYPQIVYNFFVNEVILIISCKEGFNRPKLEEITDKVKQRIKESLHITASIGIGRKKKSVLDLHFSYDEAKRALKISRQLNRRNATVFFDLLGAYHLLAPISQNDDVKNFYLGYLGELIEYDRQNSGDLVVTLEVLVAHDWNMKAAADSMFIHYNTMKYRYKKISDLLKADLQNPEEKLNITLSVKLLQLAK